jgi:hypothetical protein
VGDHYHHHGAEPLLRSRQLCRYSRTSQHFMEPEGSLPCSQELVPILSQIDPVHTIPSQIYILISSIHLRLGLPSGALFFFSSSLSLQTDKTLLFFVFTMPSFVLQ